MWNAKLWLLVVASVMLWSPPASGQENLGVPPVTEYDHLLPLRAEPANHASAVIIGLCPYDSAVLVDDWIGEDHLIMIWNSALAHVQFVWNDVPLELTLYYDVCGRPAFMSDYVNGWVDVVDGYLFCGLDLYDGSGYRYVGLMPDQDGFSAVLTRPVDPRTRCICKGTLLELQCKESVTACQDERACSYIKKTPGGTPEIPPEVPNPAWVVTLSECKWLIVPQPRPKLPGGATGND